MSDQVKPDVSDEALAWAEYLYEEYMRSKHKKFSISTESKIIDTEMRGK